MRDLGRRQRQLREFAGLSQEQLARLAGVSQGSVSRLEIGRALATPLLIVLKINAALVRELHRLDPAILSPELREALALQSGLVPARGALGFSEVPLAEGSDVEELVRLYRESPERQRAGILAVLRALCRG
jgi:transcriptional regulator with XRE-family HTH domain